MKSIGIYLITFKVADWLYFSQTGYVANFEDITCTVQRLVMRAAEACRRL